MTLGAAIQLNGQAISINEMGAPPNSKAILDVSSTTKGMLVPRMTTTERLAINAGSSETGMMVFDTTLGRFMFFNGSTWIKLGEGFWSENANGIYRNGAVGVGSVPSTTANLRAETSTYPHAGYLVNNMNSASTTYGVYGAALGTGSGEKRGGSFEATGGTGTNIGVRGVASGGLVNWAGYFSTGNVFVQDSLLIGLETGATGYKLAVDGKIMCEELKVQSSDAWPDYVFASGYDLLPVSRLESHIRQYGHLPGIPSAKEVEDDGIQVGKMQRKLLEKIEELTLYIIDQDKRIAELEHAIANQQRD